MSHLFVLTVVEGGGERTGATFISGFLEASENKTKSTVGRPSCEITDFM